MNIFEKLRSGEPVDMLSEEYRPAVAELHRADKVLFHLNHAEPQSEEWCRAFSELFDGEVPEGLGIFTPTQIDFPKQITFGKHVFINHNFTAMSIGGIEFGDNVQIGPHVTIVTDNHDLTNRYVLKCRRVIIGNNVWMPAAPNQMNLHRGFRQRALQKQHHQKQLVILPKERPRRQRKLWNTILNSFQM